MPRSDPAALARLRETLTENGYTDAVLGQALGGTAGFGLPAFDPALVARRLPGGGLGDLVTLFMLGGGVRQRRVERLFGKRGCAELVRAGILTGEGERVSASVAIHAWADLLLACDRLDAAGRADQVVGMTPAAVTLAHLTIHPEGATALDLGTGCGVEAILASSRSDQVVATDVNPRAIEYAGINARLNGVRNLELLTGDWFAPVDGRLFHLIVSNPPFVISPDSTLVYRDGEDSGDGVSRHVVTEAARHLGEGGFATVLCNWIRRSDGEPDAPVGWVKDGGCDAIVLRYGLDDPVAYAASWNHALRAADPAAFEAALDRWTEHYRALGVRAIGSGAVVLRRRAQGDPRVTALTALEMPTGAAGAQLRRIFDSQQLLAEGDDALLAARLRPADGHGIEQTLTFTDGRYAAGGGLAVLEPGAGLAVEIEQQHVDLLQRCDGTLAVGELGPDPDLALIRRLLEVGALAAVR